MNEIKRNKFSVITAAYKKEEELFRAINSVINQTYTNWEMIIISDAPDFDYTKIKTLINNYTNIKFIENKENKGNNYSKNLGISEVSHDSDFVVILDDDDWFNEDSLQKANNIINENPKYNWFVSNRAYSNDKSITINKKKINIINYIWDCMILKKFNGDATHFVNLKKFKKIKYSNSVKLTEEWFYFSQLSKDFLYYDFNSTYQDLHSESNMTTFYNKNKKMRLKNTFKLFIELISVKKFNISLWFVYLPLRILAILIK